jgi:hypothetical protein
MEVGFGYEFLSQEYFADSLLADSIESALALKTSYLDDFKGQISLEYAPGDSRALVLRSVYEQSDQDLRLRLAGYWRGRLGSMQLETRTEFDWREHDSDSAGTNDGYILGRTRLGARVPLNAEVSARGWLKADIVRYDLPSAYQQNHYRIEARAGLAAELGDLSMLEGGLFFLTRQVADSIQLNYKSLGAEGTFFGLYGTGDINLAFRAEKKDYNRPDRYDDYTRVEVDGRNSLRFGRQFFARQELDLEIALFAEEDLLNLNYTRLRVGLLGGLDYRRISLAAGPVFEYLWEEDANYSGGQDYSESGFKVGVDVVTPTTIFASVESEIGLRNQREETFLQSDFVYERLNLMADWRVIGGLEFHILFAAEWEWHENPDENNRILLLSAGLSHQF